MKTSKVIITIIAGVALLGLWTTRAPAQQPPAGKDQIVQEHLKDVTDLIDRLNTLTDRAHTMAQMVSQQLTSGKGNQFGDQVRKLQDFDVAMGNVADQMKTAIQRFIALREDPMLTRDAAAGKNIEDLQAQLRSTTEKLSSAMRSLEDMNKQLLGRRAK